jgi:uncharacterized protein (DUF3820 family)
MSYGKYKGDKFEDIPAEYLLYMLSIGKLFGNVKDYVLQNKETLEIQDKNDKKGIH